MIYHGIVICVVLINDRQSTVRFVRTTNFAPISAMIRLNFVASLSRVGCYELDFRIAAIINIYR
jgi:hypothetical protein